MRILITGGSGQVGFELRRSLSSLGTVVAPTRQELDLSDLETVETFLNTEKPDLIVNAAAYTAVDKAESETKRAKALNTDLPGELAKYAKRRNVWLVHYSSDYVYPGSGNNPYSEASETGPLGVYGQTKLRGDEAIASTGCSYLVFRTSWVYSARGHNFMKTMLRLGKERDELAVVADQIGAPTPARLIADITARAIVLIQRGETSGEWGASRFEPGIYHLAPRGETSWHGFAQSIFSLASEMGLDLDIRSDRMKPISTAEYPTPAERPLNSRLSLDRLEAFLGCELPNWKSQLELTLEEYLTIN